MNNCVLPNLKSYTSYDVIVAVRNVIGTTETRIDPVRTMDGFPEQIPAYQISTYSTGVLDFEKKTDFRKGILTEHI